VAQEKYRGRSEIGIVSVLTRFDSCKILIRFMGTGGIPRSIRGSHPCSLREPPSTSTSDFNGRKRAPFVASVTPSDSASPFLRLLRFFAAILPSSVLSVSSCKILPCIPCVPWATPVRLLLPLCPRSVASVTHSDSESPFLRPLRLFAAIPRQAARPAQG